MSDPTFYVDQTKPWLGGFCVGGDAATFYPELWAWLVKECGVESVIDVGCGEGHAARYFADLGCEVIGVDGVWQLSQNWQFVMHDYTRGSWPREVRGNRMEGATDLIWCCEFVEHLEERFVPNFLETFQMGSLILMTHAEPGQAGHHHVNCQPAAYWQGAMAAIGYQLAREFTTLARLYAGANPNPYNHFARSGLAFTRS